MALIEINWKPGPRELRSFGWSMLIGFGVLGLLFLLPPPGAWWRSDPTLALVLWGFGALSGGLSLGGSKAALPFYFLWMGIAWLCGNTVSRLLLVFLYYGIVTPIGVVLRLAGRDSLSLRRPSGRASYWRDIVEKVNYERQF